MNNICVFDLETDSVDTSLCNPTQIACLMINPYKLEVIEGSEFYSRIKPENIESSDYLTTADRKKTIDFHCRNRGMSQDEILEEWKNSPELSVVWKEFGSHINKYNITNTVGGGPWAAGINIINFDLPIVNRINIEYKVKRMFGHEVIDLRHLLFYWLVWDSGLKSRGMDSIRKHFGMSFQDAHNALVDVRQEAEIILKFLALHKTLYPKIKFKNCLAPKLETV